MLMATAGAAARTGADIAGKAAASVGKHCQSDGPDRRHLVAATDHCASQHAASRRRSGSDHAQYHHIRSSFSTRHQTQTTRKRAPRSRAYWKVNGGRRNVGPRPQQTTRLVAQRAGISQPEAEKRVADAITAARDAADKARRGAVLTGFVTAASLIISLAAAWWAGIKGGNHRDNAIPARFNFVVTRRS